ncbi:MAG: flagellar biosynthetic protein FliO [Deltaproteobacteria bacterium]|nr:flagellar biosynthetic protein FliO [Deltaproteobacteria bacterium]
MGSEYYFELIKMVTALVLVLGVMYLAFFVAKKTIWKGLATGASGVPIRILAQRSLGSRKSIVVVEADGQRMVLGVTSDRINLLAKTESSAPEGSSMPAGQGGPHQGIFPRMLAAFVNRGEGIEKHENV